MRILAFVALAVMSCGLWADDAPKGVPARPAPSDYAANAKWQNTTFAVSLVPPKEVEHLFAFDISKSYLVFEVACYTEGVAGLTLSHNAFVVKVNASGDALHNADPDTVAAAVQRQSLPPMPSSVGPHVATSATIGYEHGTDPYTGRPISGVYTAGSATVEQGGSETMPPPYSKPGATSEDRRMLAAQLRARSLPDGPVTHAVAGYIYFRKSDLKAQPDGTYALQYLANDEASGGTHAVILAVPKKTH
jgi:hypothetical protein